MSAATQTIVRNYFNLDHYGYSSTSDVGQHLAGHSCYPHHYSSYLETNSIQYSPRPYYEEDCDTDMLTNSDSFSSSLPEGAIIDLNYNHVPDRQSQRSWHSYTLETESSSSDFGDEEDDDEEPDLLKVYGGNNKLVIELDEYSFGSGSESEEVLEAGGVGGEDWDGLDAYNQRRNRVPVYF
jgi:hypothetical protein